MEKPDKATVKAKIAGTVTTSCDKGTVPTDGSAAIVVKAADGMYVKTSISEMELSNIKVGGTIKCVSSDTGDEYTAERKFRISLPETVVMMEEVPIQIVLIIRSLALLKMQMV